MTFVTNSKRPSRRQSLNHVSDFAFPFPSLTKSRALESNCPLGGTLSKMTLAKTEDSWNKNGDSSSPLADIVPENGNIFEATFEECENFNDILKDEYEREHASCIVADGLEVPVIHPIRAKLDKPLPFYDFNDLEKEEASAASPHHRSHSKSTRRKRRSRQRSLDSSGIREDYKALNDKALKVKALTDMLLKESSHSSWPSFSSDLALPSPTRSNNKPSESREGKEEGINLQPLKPCKRDLKRQNGSSLAARLNASASSATCSTDDDRDEPLVKSKRETPRRSSSREHRKSRRSVERDSSTPKLRTRKHRQRSCSQSHSRSSRRSFSMDKAEETNNLRVRRQSSIREQSFSSLSSQDRSARLRAGNRHNVEYHWRRRNSVGHEMLKQAVAAVENFSENSHHLYEPEAVRKPFSPVDDKVDAKALQRASRILISHNRRKSIATTAA